MSAQEQAKFEGWAIVEMMGHRREVGFVTTENYGAASLFRIDTPGLEDREHVIERPTWIRTDAGVEREAPIGSKVKRPGFPPRSVLISPASIYAINPCDEATAKRAIERAIPRPLVLLSVPEGKQLSAASEDPEDSDIETGDGGEDFEI
jgi:hypothetical protein